MNDIYNYVCSFFKWFFQIGGLLKKLHEVLLFEFIQVSVFAT